MSEAQYLTPADIEGRPLDRRCIVCLERAYQIWVGYNPETQVGCPYGHTHKEKCDQFAVPHAENRAAIQKLKAQGFINTNPNKG